MAKIAFYGACREVTGSNVLVETLGKKILLECGIFQGARLSEKRNYAPFNYDPSSVDMVVICHAHLDHTGRLPKLVHEGFSGRIYATGPTAQLTRLVLEDSWKLMADEARRDKHSLLFEKEDIEKTMELFNTFGYGENVEIWPGIGLLFKNAGHILGSAVAVLSLGDQKLVYSSDLGNTPSELLPAKDPIDEADFVIMESTYGGRIHEDISRRGQKLNSVIESTIAQGGVLMIPAFAIERTQELLHDIEHFCTVNNCQIPRFFLDSPLASKVTKVFDNYPQYLNPQLKKVHSEDIFGLRRLKITSTVEESVAIGETPNPKIIIAGSGMLNGGRILYHLTKYIEDYKNTLLIVGWQAQGTLGRRLIEGEKVVKIFGKKYQVLAKVLAIGSYSAHADSLQLEDWLKKIRGVRKVFLTHGEVTDALAFAKKISNNLEIETIVPNYGDQYQI